MGDDGNEASPKSPPDKGEDAAPPPVPTVGAESSFSDVRLLDAPILLLVYFHKAMREELADLCHVAALASERGSYGHEVIVELRRRFDFLKIVYNYHCAAEDEVIFLALDVHVKNVAHTYLLEHKFIDDLFDHIFHCLNELEDDKNGLKPLQELFNSIHTMESSISQHMLKEEEQVFPLLMKQFSPEDQASLVWKFICSIPVILLEDMLPWMMNFLCEEKQVEVLHCIGEIVPEEKLLQEVMISWLRGNNQSSSGAFTKGKNVYNVQTNAESNLFDSLYLWHGAILTDFKEILEELYQIMKSSTFLNVDSIVVRLKFLADVVIFYSNALKKFFYPLFLEHGNNQSFPSSTGEFPIQSCIERLHQLLQSHAQDGLPLCQFVQKLSQELEYFVTIIGQKFHFQETEVFPLIGKTCSHETQLQLLYMSLHVMPLGLLKCVITWFAFHLSESVSRSFLHSINQGDFVANKPFVSLLLEWFRIGYSGKISIENFGKELQTMFKSRCTLLSEQIKEPVGCASTHLNIQAFKEFEPGKLEPLSANKGQNGLSYLSAFSSEKAKMYETSYSREINLHIFFPGMMSTLHPFPKIPGEESSAASVVNEPKPVDLMFFFHKALKKDVEYLVSCSAQLAGNVGILKEFLHRFQLLKFRFQFHSDVEDEIAFPALEAKGKLQNISHSYGIDHRLQLSYFNEISLLLDEMSKLHVAVSTGGSNMHVQRMVKHNRLCMKLHHMCKSMHKLFSDHAHREEVELWPFLRECFSIQEQEKIIGYMLGRMRAETLQDMIPWLMGSSTPEEQNKMMSLWRKVTRNTMFDEWLGEWWEVYDIARMEQKQNTSFYADPMEIISRYMSVETHDKQGAIPSEKDYFCAGVENIRNCSLDYGGKAGDGDQDNKNFSERKKHLSGGDNKRCDEVAEVMDKPIQPFQLTLKSRHHERLLTISQADVEAAIRRVSRDISLDPQKKSYIIQNLLMSRWIVQQQISQADVTISSDGKEIPGQHPSYRDSSESTMGCKHYKRNCKLLTACCNQLHTCIHCHDDVADHSTDKKAITKMMCMKCLVIQPIGQTCSTASCNNFSMARYYCKICKLFEDGREIYHCPFCNLCRVGKGLGIDYFHCMNCNACMSKSLLVHICREKCLEDNCPICHEYIFTSLIPAKALPCGHLMHSTCFQDYTFTHYTCPICSKSLGDMQVYFKMLDAFLAEEKIPDEYIGRTQVILCNDCEKKGAVPFHWLYHKCSYCGSYNTRVL